MMDVVERQRPPVDLGGARAAVAHWAATRPQDIALLHKARGLWHALPWPAVEAFVARITTTLTEDEGGAPPRLIVSGDIDTVMIIFALAAHAAGGTVDAVPRGLRGDALQARIDDVRPSHVYLRNRRDLPHWSDIRLPDDATAKIFLRQVSPRRLGPWQLRLVPGGGETPSPVKGPLGRAVKRQTVLWAEEGSNWPDGLSLLIDAWLERGAILALPETGDSVLRDRVEVQPTELLLSPARWLGLRAELDGRLPPGGWLRRLCDRALAGTGGGVSGQLRRRLRRLSGTSRLSATAARTGA